MQAKSARGAKEQGTLPKHRSGWVAERVSGRNDDYVDAHNDDDGALCVLLGSLPVR